MCWNQMAGLTKPTYRVKQVIKRQHLQITIKFLTSDTPLLPPKASYLSVKKNPEIKTEYLQIGTYQVLDWPILSKK